MLVVPVQALASQVMSVLLGNQDCQINLYQKSTGLYLDLYVSNALLIGGVSCLNAVRIVRSAYLGFIGDLGFWDTQGTTDPYYTGLGSRYVLYYLSATDLAGS